jgi:GGDEF domain-containing protein
MRLPRSGECWRFLKRSFAWADSTSMSAALPDRRLLVGAAVLCYLAAFGAVVGFDRPGLGVGRFFFVAVVLLGLASGPFAGAAGGLLAGGLYAAAVLVNSDLPDDPLLGAPMAIRLITYIGVGALSGFFAAQHRAVAAYLQILGERDRLTGLPTSRPFEKELSRRLDTGTPFVLLLADVDGLDDGEESEIAEVMGKLPGTLAPWLGAGDTVARVSAREYAVLIQLRSSEEAGALAAVLETALAGHGLDVTFGWALSPRDGRNGLALYRAASDRLHARTILRRHVAAAG